MKTGNVLPLTVVVNKVWPLVLAGAETGMPGEVTPTESNSEAGIEVTALRAAGSAAVHADDAAPFEPDAIFTTTRVATTATTAIAAIQVNRPAGRPLAAFLLAGRCGFFLALVCDTVFPSFCSRHRTRGLPPTYRRSLQDAGPLGQYHEGAHGQ